MNSQETHPALLTKVRSKHGRCDYQRFDNITSTHMRCGRGSIGKVQVDCRFMFSQSQWGVIGHSRNPGGIIFLDLDFNQPADCKLESATITVTLADDENTASTKGNHQRVYPVRFTDYYGPKSIRGEQSVVQTKNVKNGTPEVQLFGYGAGGLGLNKEKTVLTKNRWDFSGRIDGTDGCVWYNSLRWELKENSLEWLPTHGNVFHTAFAMEHNATKFYMTVQVSGKLAKRSDRIKNRFRFGGKGKKDEEIITKFEWAEGYSCPTRLDELAQHLHEIMGSRNMEKVAVEMPSAVPASHHPAVTSQIPAPAALHAQTNSLLGHQHPSLGSWLRPNLLLAVGGRASTSGALAQPPLGNLLLDELSSMAAAIAHHPQLHPPRPPLLSTSMPAMPASTVTEVGETESTPGSSTATLVNSAMDTQIGGGDAGSLATNGLNQDSGEKEPEAEPQGKDIWLRVIAVLLGWFRTAGVLLWGLASIVGLPLAGIFRSEQREKKGKTASSDAGSESSRLKVPKAKPGYLLRARPRGRRGRPSLTLSKQTGKQRAKVQ